MLTPEDLFTLALDGLARRRASAATRAIIPDRTPDTGRSGAIRALGRALVAAGSRLEGRSPGRAPVPPARHGPCHGEARLPRAA